MSSNNLKKVDEELGGRNNEPPSEMKSLDETFEISKNVPLESSHVDEQSSQKSLNTTQNCSFSSSILNDNGYSDIIKILEDVLPRLTDKINTSAPVSPPIEHKTSEKENETIVKNKPDFDKEPIIPDISAEVLKMNNTTIILLNESENDTMDKVPEALNETFPTEENVSKILKLEEVTSFEPLNMNATVVIDLSESVNVEETTEIVSESFTETFSKAENVCKTLKVEEVTSGETRELYNDVIELSESINDEEALDKTLPKCENVCKRLKVEETREMNDDLIDLSGSVINEETNNIVSGELDETFSKCENICKTLKVEEVTSGETREMYNDDVIELSESINDEEALDKTVPKCGNVCNRLKVEEDTSQGVSFTREMNNDDVIELSESVNDEETNNFVSGELDETFPKCEIVCKTFKAVEVTPEEALKTNTTVDLSKTLSEETTNTVYETFPKKENVCSTTKIEEVTSKEALEMSVVERSESINEENINVVSAALNVTLPIEEKVCKTMKDEEVTSEKVLTASKQLDNFEEDVMYHDESTISCDEIKVLNSSDPPIIHKDLSSSQQEINQSVQESQPKESPGQNDNVLNEEDILQPYKTENTSIPSSILENCQKSVFSCLDTQPNEHESFDKSQEAITRSETDSCDKKENYDLATEAQVFKGRKSVIDMIRSKLTDAEPYSPSRLALAAAFDNLKINTSVEESFLSCEETSLINDILDNDEAMDTISENFHTTKTNEHIEDPLLVETIENNVISTQTEMASPVEHEPQINSSLSEDDFQLTPKKNTEDSNLVTGTELNSTWQQKTISESSMDDSEINDATSKFDKNLIAQKISMIPKKSRRSSGITISAMNFGMTPSPVKQHLEYLDKEYSKLFTESPSVAERKRPEYDRYLALKLEINHLQQNIAKLTLQLKQKEGEVMQFLPQKIKFPPMKYKNEVKNTLQEENKWAEERATLHDNIDQMSDILDHKNKELLKLKVKLDDVENELKGAKEQADTNLRKLKDTEEELKTSQEAVNKLEHCLNETNHVLTDATSKLDNAQECYTREKQKHESTTIALQQIIDKYEETRRIVLAMKANEIIYKETITKLRSDNDDLHKTYECFKKTAMDKIDEANKENERIRAETTTRNVLKRRNSRQP